MALPSPGAPESPADVSVSNGRLGKTETHQTWFLFKWAFILYKLFLLILYKPEIDLMASSNCKWQLGSYCLSTLLNRRRAQMLEITSIWVHKNWCYYNDKNNFFLGEMSYLLNFTSLQLLYHHHRFLKVSKVKLQNEIELICWFISDYVKVLRTWL